jgi:acyl-ACP thioesterase
MSKSEKVMVDLKNTYNSGTKDIWVDEYTIKTYDVDTRSTVTLQSICKYFQETASNHAHNLGLGWIHLLKENRIWVLSRLIIKMNRYPALGEKIKIHTWPVGLDQLFALRDFQIIDEEEKIIGAASSAFIVIDINTRRPQRINYLIDTIKSFPDKLSMDERPGEIPELLNPEKSTPFKVHYSDLDLLNHVNNTKYIEWVLDSYPYEKITSQMIKLFEIHFLTELSFDDEVIIQTMKKDDLSLLHNIIRMKDKKEACRVRIEWVRKDS